MPSIMIELFKLLAAVPWVLLTLFCVAFVLSGHVTIDGIRHPAGIVGRLIAVLIVIITVYIIVAIFE